MTKIFDFTDVSGTAESPSRTKKKKGISKKEVSDEVSQTCGTSVVTRAILEELQDAHEEIANLNELKQERKRHFNYQDDSIKITTLRIAFLVGFTCSLIFAIGLLIWRFVTSVSSFFSAFHQPTNIKFNLWMSLFMALLCFVGLFAPRKIGAFINR